MRKYALTILIILSVLSLTGFTLAIKYKNQIQELNIKIEEVDSKFEIDKELQKCASENFMTAGMNNCTQDGIDAWNKEILKYSEQIKQYLNNDDLQLFVNAQMSWEDYYKKENDFLNNAIEQKDGDIHTTITIGYLYEITKQRALSLKSYLLQLND